jgi:methionyl-tRNA formyltransferase
MNIAVLCATRRGARFLQKLVELIPSCRLVVFSFKEKPWEPPFLDEIRAITLGVNGVFHQATQVAGARWQESWQATPIDLMFAVSWRYMIPPEVYRQPRHGCFVFHDSLLPKYRGFSPTVWAIINGERQTGVTLFEVADTVDSGPIVDQQSVSIGPDDYIAGVLETVTHSYLELLERNVAALMTGRYQSHPQDHQRATYTCKRLPEDNRIDWSAPTGRIYNLIRAVSEPYPGAFTSLQGRTLRIKAAQPCLEPLCYVGRVPGRVVEIRRDGGSVVLTGDGALLLQQVQWDGHPVVPAAAVLSSPSHTLR